MKRPDAADVLSALLASASDSPPDNPHARRKQAQLDRSVQRCVAAVLDAGLRDPALLDLHLIEVRSDGGGGYVVVCAVPVDVDPDDDARDLSDTAARLSAAAPVFRAALASTLTRKRVPMLRFVVVPGGARAAGGAP